MTEIRASKYKNCKKALKKPAPKELHARGALTRNIFEKKVIPTEKTVGKPLTHCLFYVICHLAAK